MAHDEARCRLEELTPGSAAAPPLRRPADRQRLPEPGNPPAHCSCGMDGMGGVLPEDGTELIDHGPCVPESVREQLFYPFYQVSERHPRLGTGLGLAIAKGFLVLMDGEIWIEDTPGGGATFAFSLPAGVTDEEGSDPRGR